MSIYHPWFTTDHDTIMLYSLRTLFKNDIERFGIDCTDHVVLAIGIHAVESLCLFEDQHKQTYTVLQVLTALDSFITLCRSRELFTENTRPVKITIIFMACCMKMTVIQDHLRRQNVGYITC